ncbi:MAG: hypothetical protein U9Q30_02965 [Campylobacterota bacterium]|nr:hypothetical protein [Campylobacterota bacterium]
MKEIIKRLEIIKTSITIEDEEIIELQIMKLNKLDTNSEADEIITRLNDSDYSSAIVLIENYIQKYNGLVVYEDKEIQGLKLELKVLESKLQSLSENKDELLNTINEFNIEYNLKLGDIIRDILDIQNEILYKEYIAKNKHYQALKEKTQELKKKLNDLDPLEDDEYDEVYEEFKESKKKYQDAKDEFDKQEKDYNDSKSEYEEFNKEYEDIKENTKELNKDDKKELKKLYKMAAKLCHPDIVDDEFKEKAHNIMQELNDAYSKKDLNKIKEILYSLENGDGFEVSSEVINNSELLKAKIEELKEHIESVTTEIDNIKNSDSYKSIIDIDDWEDYFKSLKSNLQNQYENLKREKDSIQKEDSNYWDKEF